MSVFLLRRRPQKRWLGKKSVDRLERWIAKNSPETAPHCWVRFERVHDGEKEIRYCPIVAVQGVKAKYYADLREGEWTLVPLPDPSFEERAEEIRELGFTEEEAKAMALREQGYTISDIMVILGETYERTRRFARPPMARLH